MSAAFTFCCLAAMVLIDYNGGLRVVAEIDPDLTGLWPLTRATGARDVSPYGRDATLENNATYENGDCGVLQVRETGGSVTIDQLPEERGKKGSFTITMWIRVHKTEISTSQSILTWNDKDGKTLFGIHYQINGLLVWRNVQCRRHTSTLDWVELNPERWRKIEVAYEGERGVLCFDIGQRYRCWIAANFGAFLSGGFAVGKEQGVCRHINLRTATFDLFCLQLKRTPRSTQRPTTSFDDPLGPCYKWKPNVCQVKPNDSGNGHFPPKTAWPSSTRSTSTSSISTISTNSTISSNTRNSSISTISTSTRTSSISSGSSSNSSSNIIIDNSTSVITHDKVGSSRKPSWKAVAYGFLVAAVIAFVAVVLCALLYRRLHNRGVLGGIFT